MLSSTVDKHWVPVPVWKWWSRRVPMCCLQVITNINNTHILNRKCWTRIGFRQNIFFASESLHQLLDLESANQSLQTEQRWKKYKFSSSSTPFFRCFKTLGAGCKPLPLKTRKCLHFPKLLCLGIFWQKSDLIGVLVDIDWEIGSRSIVPIFCSHCSRRLLTIYWFVFCYIASLGKVGMKTWWYKWLNEINQLYYRFKIYLCNLLKTIHLYLKCHFEV